MDVNSAIRLLVKEMVTDEVRQQLALALAQAGVDRADQRLMSQEEAAVYAGVDVSTIRRWKKRGLKALGRHKGTRIRLNDLVAFLESQAESAPPPTPDGDVNVRARVLAQSIAARRKAG